MIAITGATGQLGQLAIQSLLNMGVPASELVAVVRSEEKGKAFAEQGIELRVADYNNLESLTTAFQGIEKLLFISSSELGKRVPQHKNVIDAAVTANVGLIAYTSLLNAPTSPLPLADDHNATEQLLSQSGLPVVLFRNGWYSENYIGGLPSALEHGVLAGSANDGKISSAPRADFAEAIAKVLTLEDQAGKVYEFAGDDAYTLTELARYTQQITGKPLAYNNMSEKEYDDFLVSVGLPNIVANLLSSSDAGAAQGGLFDDGKQLSTILGRPTVSIQDQLKTMFS